MSEVIEKVPTHYANDGDVIKITESKLYLATSYFNQIYAGTYSTTIAYVMLVVGILGPFIPIYLYIWWTYSTDWEYYTAINGGLLLGLFLVLLPFFMAMILWRRELPLCVDGKKGMIYGYRGGKLYEASKDNLVSYVNTLVSPGSASSVCRFELHEVNNKEKIYTFLVYGELHTKVLVDDFLEGKEIVLSQEDRQTIKRGNGELNFQELFHLRFLAPYSRLSLVWKILYYPFYLLYAIFMGFPVDLLMYVLNKVLPRRKIPEELREACGMGDDEKVFG
jgi:hypothetical protein